MADCVLTLDVLDPEDNPVANGALGIAPADTTVTGAGVMVADEQLYELSDPFNTVTLVQGALYRFREYKPTGRTFYAEVPAASTEDYSDLVSIVPPPVPPEDLDDLVTELVDGPSDTHDAIRDLTRPLPSYIPQTVDGEYDQRTNIYNLKPTSLRRTRAQLGAAATDGPAAGLCRIAVLGDSKSDQFNGSNAGNGGYDITFTKWPWKLRKRLAAAIGAPLGGTGFVKCYHAGVYDPRWSFTGVWTNDLTGPFSYTLAVGAKATFSTLVSGETGTIFEVVISDYSAAQVTIKVDGATSGPGYLVVTNTNTNAMKKVTLTGLADTTHSVEIINDNAYTFIYGACIRRTTGLIVDNFAINGGSALHYAAGSAIGNLARFYLPDPDLVIPPFGPNDLVAMGRTPTQAIADLDSMLDLYPAGTDVLFVAEDQLTSPVQSVWEEYVRRLYELVDSRGLDEPLVDLCHRWGAATDLIHQAHLIDGVHHDAALDNDWAAAFMAVLTTPGGTYRGAIAESEVTNLVTDLAAKTTETNRRLQVPDMLTTLYYESQFKGASFTTASPTLNVVHYDLIYIPNQITVSALAARMAGTNASAVFNLGIYAAGANGGAPGARLAFGTVAAPSPGLYSVTGLSPVLTPGFYYLAFLITGATAACAVAAGGAVLPARGDANAIPSANLGPNSGYMQTGQTSLPATATPVAASTTEQSRPRVALRVT